MNELTEEKIKAFLSKGNGGYVDVMKKEILYYLFERFDGELEFWSGVGGLTEEEFQQKVEFTVSKMILHEHESGLEDIIEEYLICW